MSANIADLKDRKVLVIGGNGFIGRHIVRALHGAGAEVGIMDIAPSTEEFRRFDQVIGSIDNPALVASAVAGCDHVIFLANSSLPGSANTDMSAEVDAHVRVSVKVAEICNSQGVKRFVFSSSGGTVYGYSSETPIREDMPTHPRNAYGVSKLAIEHYLRLIATLRDMDTVSLRVSNPYGPGQRALRSQGFVAAAMQHAMSGKTLPIWGDGSVERDFIHVKDVARAFALTCVAEAPPDVMNIGSGQALSLLQILERIETASGRKVPVRFEPGRTVDVARNVLDTTRAAEAIGWSPAIKLHDGLAETAAWWETSGTHDS